jgi:hypothetical protein
MSGYLEWANDAADRLDRLDEELAKVKEDLWGHTDTNRILKQWGELVDNLGVMRKRDDLRIEVTPYVEWRFCSHSSGAYLDGILHVLVFRDGVSHRASLRVREDVRILDGKVSRFVDDEGVTRTARPYITETTLPDKARNIVNLAILGAWDYMAENLADILGECVAYQVAKELRDGKTYAARRILAEYGGVK